MNFLLFILFFLDSTVSYLGLGLGLRTHLCLLFTNQTFYQTDRPQLLVFPFINPLYDERTCDEHVHANHVRRCASS